MSERINRRCKNMKMLVLTVIVLLAAIYQLLSMSGVSVNQTLEFTSSKSAAGMDVVGKMIPFLWTNGTGSALYIKSTTLSDILRRVPVTPRDPAMCDNLLDCTLLFMQRYLKLPEQLGGSLVIATGDGRSYSLSYAFGDGSAAQIIVETVVEGARKTTRPTIFHISAMDGDVFHKRHHCKSAEQDPFPLSQDFPFVIFLSPVGVYAPGGRIIPNSIPIPDHMTIGGGGGDTQKECEDKKLPTAGEGLAARIPKALFFGATTGYSRHFGKGMPYTYTDRFQLVDQLLGSNISNAYFTNLVQDISLPANYMGPGVHSPTWSTRARYIIDSDGNTNAWSALNWKLCSGGPVIKVNSSSSYVQWYYHLLEHGVNVHMVDVFRQDLEEEISRVMNDIPYATKLAKNAAAFCCKHLMSRDQVAYLRTLVATVWETPEYRTRDWRIRSPPSDHLRPMLSPFVRYGPMKRIKQALAVGGAVDANGVPTALLNLAKLPDMRKVCVFGSGYPTSLGRQFLMGLFGKSLVFKGDVASCAGCAPCDMVVLLKDALNVSDDEMLKIVSREYHVIVSLGVVGGAANATALRKAETVVGEWPSVSGVVTQIQSILKYPDNYIQEPYFPCPSRFL